MDTDLLFWLFIGVAICIGLASSFKKTRGMSPSSFRRWALSQLLVTAALLIWFSFARVYRHYQSTCPTVADENAGRIYSLNEHGHVVYLTWSEQSSLISLALATAVCFFSGYLVDRKIRKALAGPKQDNPPA
jgi:hypothetical protein